MAAPPARRRRVGVSVELAAGGGVARAAVVIGLGSVSRKRHGVMEGIVIVGEAA
jgi:hypothetical protein